MKSIKLSLWQRLVIEIGLNEGCDKTYLIKKLKSNPVSVYETLNELIKKTYIREEKTNNRSKLFVVNTKIFNALQSLIKHMIEDEVNDR